MSYWLFSACVSVMLVSAAYAGGHLGLLPQSVAAEPLGEAPQVCLHALRGRLEARPSAIRWRPYDVLRYELFLDWVQLLSRTGTAPDDRVFRGVNRITLRVDSSQVLRLAFDAAEMTLERATVNGLPAVVSQPAGDSIIVELPAPASAGDTLVVELTYRSHTQRNLGLYLYPKGMFVGTGPAGDSVFVEERLAYTMSEPEDARYWMPCNDAPHDKAIAEIAVAVPDGFVVASNGWLDTVIVIPGATPEAPTVLVYRWRDTVPIATYLMAVHASRYASFGAEYVRPDGSRVPLLYYVWPTDVESADTTGRRYNARYAFRNVPEMMRAYEHFFGRYPFVKYGMAAVQPFAYGGMEHQTITTVNRSWLRGWAELGIAHELAHHWIGNLVSCATWNDIWLNEGGATWSEALWLEWMQGPEAYRARMERARRDYFEQRSVVTRLPLYAPPRQLIFFYATTYAKAAWVYHMMRRLVGDSLFFPALRAYMQRHRYGAAETEDFLASLQADIPHPPVSWRTFFEQWIYSAGHPIVELVPMVSPLPDGQYWVRCLVRQVQSGAAVPSVFVMPWVVRFQGAQGQYAEQRFVSTEREHLVEAVLPFLPTTVSLDTEAVLCEYTVAPLSVASEGVRGASVSVLPQPASEGAVVVFQLPWDGMVELELVTLTGARLRVYQSFLAAGAYRFPLPLRPSEHAAGIYAVRLWIDGRMSALHLFQWQP